MGKFVEEIKRSDRKRLFCFPYAGGGASIYRDWQKAFSNVRVYGMQYPGKEKRISEKPIVHMEELVNKMEEELYPFMNDCPFILFGHSLGTKVEYELSLKIHSDLGIWPEKIIVSGGRAPSIREPQPIYDLEDDLFIKKIMKRYKSIPEELASSKEIMDIFLPSIRADFIIDETYERTDIEKVECPITGLMGKHDQEMSLDDMKMWEQFTAGGFTYEIIEGDHMFINNNFESIHRIIKRML
jgi:surfactin synthase thioesterase subunit